VNLFKLVSDSEKSTDFSDLPANKTPRQVHDQRSHRETASKFRKLCPWSAKVPSAAFWAFRLPSSNALRSASVPARYIVNCSQRGKSFASAFADLPPATYHGIMRCLQNKFPRFIHSCAEEMFHEVFGCAPTQPHEARTCSPNTISSCPTRQKAAIDFADVATRHNIGL